MVELKNYEIWDWFWGEKFEIGMGEIFYLFIWRFEIGMGGTGMENTDWGLEATVTGWRFLHGLGNNIDGG